MANWSRAWNGCGSNVSSSCAAGCFNPLYPAASTQGNVLDGFPLSIQTCGQAMHEFGQALQSALPAQNVIVKTNSSASYTLDVRIDPKVTATATIQFQGNTCDFPVSATYAKGGSSGSAKFSGLTELLNWLVSVLR